MGNIGYQEAKSEILERFQSNNKRVIFWYDENAKFQEDIQNDSFLDIKVIFFHHNEFEIKYIIEVLDEKSKFLIYFPEKRPENKSNWLLDMLLYSDEYYADDVALAMRNLELTNSNLRTIIANHIKFFKSSERVNALKKAIHVTNKMTGQELILGMVAVLTKSKFAKINDILKELIFDIEDNEKINSLINFGFEDYVWSAIGEFTNYTGEQTITALVRSFMMTVVAETSNIQEYSSFYAQYIDKNKKTSTDALRLLDDLKLDNRYASLQEFIGKSLKIQELVKSRGLDAIDTCDVFEYFDSFIVDTVLTSLNNGSLDYDYFEKIIISKRSNSMWYKNYQLEYEIILAIINFQRMMDLPFYENEAANEYIRLYADKLYKIDQAYRRSASLFRKVDNDEKLEQLFEKINLKYENGFLRKIGSYFSTALTKMESWNFSLPTINHFYEEIIRSVSYKKMIVIISDALRYEAAAELFEEIKTEQGLKGKASIEPIVSTIPSITKFGMASLLPNKTIQYSKDDILVDGNNSQGIEKRDKILKSKNESFAAIGYQTIKNFNRNELREYMKDKNLVYIYHDEIDATGEKLEDNAFEATKSTIQVILNLIKKLYNNLQISNFIVTSDHGYIYRHTKIGDSQKYDGITKLKLLETSKRYVITNDQTTIDDTLDFKLDYLGKVNEHRVITPFGYDIFKSQGGGSQYLHGGASLQEIVVPVIKVSELRSGAVKENIGPVEVRIKSINRLVTQRSFTVDFEQTEKVADKKSERELQAYFVDESNQEVSGKVKFIANSESDDLSQRLMRIRFNLNNTLFDKNKRYFLVLKDNEGEILREPFTIDILSFKSIF